MAYCTQCRGVMESTAVVCPHCGYTFPDDKKTEWPFWVHMGMAHLIWTSRTRSTAVTLFYVAIVVDLVTFLMFLWDRDWLFVTLILSIAIAWSGLAIRWVDKYGRWPS